MISFDPFWGPALAEEAGTHFNPECDVSIARLKRVGNGEWLQGGVVFQNFTHESMGIHVSAFTPGWIDKAMLWITFDYAFNQCGVMRLFGQVPADKPDVLKFDLKLGFKEITRIPGVFRGGVDDIIVCMERSDCKYLKMAKPTIHFDLDLAA